MSQNPKETRQFASIWYFGVFCIHKLQKKA